MHSPYISASTWYGADDDKPSPGHLRKGLPQSKSGPLDPASDAHLDLRPQQRVV